MMKNLCAVTLLAASLYTGNVYAQPAAVKKIIEIGTTDNRVMHQLDVLTVLAVVPLVQMLMIMPPNGCFANLEVGVSKHIWKKPASCLSALIAGRGSGGLSVVTNR